MLPYVIVAIAVVVLLGMGVLGILLIRRARGVAEAMEAVGAVEEVDEGLLEVSPPGGHGSESASAAGAWTAAKPPVHTPEPEYLVGVEQLLTEWRAKHDLAAVQAATRRDEGAGEPVAQVALDELRSPRPRATSLAPAAEAEPTATAGAAFTAPTPSRTIAVHDASAYGMWGDPAAAQAMMLVDPLGMVVLDMLAGKGRLTPSELKRLDVFRPERIDLAVQTLQLPPRLQGDEDAALRLAQVQLYAATLELRAKWSAQSARLQAGAAPFTARDFKLKIARDIMELPDADRAEVIGYLLGGLLNNPGSTPDLKRAVIDVLEHLRSAALVNVLLDCLDDPDPIVQEYALAAADRLLDK